MAGLSGFERRRAGRRDSRGIRVISFCNDRGGWSGSTGGLRGWWRARCRRRRGFEGVCETCGYFITL